MSGNSWARPLQTAPIVIDFCGRSVSMSGTSVGISGIWSIAITISSAREERELVLADLQLVAVLEMVGLDAVTVDVRAVERAEVVEVPVAAAAHEQGVVARDRDVVEKARAVGTPADRDPIAVQREALPHATAAAPDHQRGSLRCAHALALAGDR